MKLALAQCNPIIGDIAGNRALAVDAIRRARQAGAALVVFGELSICGYPPRDLLGKERFVTDMVAAVESLAAECTDIAALVGFVRPTPGLAGRQLQNAAAFLQDGQVRHIHVKTLLPTYDVFDETRYFEPGDEVGIVEVAGVKVGVSICEDLWDADSLGRAIYPVDPIQRLRDAGASLIVNMAASPFEVGKAARREELFTRQSQRHNVPIAYVNQVGGNDELVFDGGSCLVTPAGLIARAHSFAEDLLLVEVPASSDVAAAAATPPPPLAADLAQLRDALTLGLRDYVQKCGFSKVVLGLSGGIDSAIVATLAADALGGENVQCLAMPSRYSSDHSLADAEALAENLGCPYVTIPIEAMHASYVAALRGSLGGEDDLPGVVGENIQARIRGDIVMAWSNAQGALALATGNKSELAVGYCTLYGDMCGGLAPIGDVLKTQVYALCRHINEVAGNPRIPENTLTKPPSAELKPGQTDQDKLPDYDELDAILEQYIEKDRTACEILAQGWPGEESTLRRIVRMVDLAEYKRQQAARVLKVSARAFGMGRRVPIAQRYIVQAPTPTQP